MPRLPSLRPFAVQAFALVLLAFSLLFAAATARAEEEFLDPNVAFKFSARMADPQTIAVTYEIADKYYMYREPFAFSATGATLGTPQLPAGKVKYDETFQKDVETYRKVVTITIPVQADGMFTLKAVSQGCADAGLCYSPQEATARLVGGGSGPAMSLPGAADPVSPAGPATPATGDAPGSELSGIASVLGGGKLLVILPAFLLLGLGLAFTPCVLPMVPILSSIIVGEGAQVKRSRGFVLSVAYSLGMAIVYTALGVAAGLIGEGLAATLQNPWVLGAVALLMVVMALSMFGFYNLQLPAGLQTRLAGASGRQSSGKLAGVFAMGAISALIVGPCVAAPLAGALVYISQTRDVLVGGAALFAMAVGMSIPLLLVGVSAGSLLPRAGSWMEAVKKFFGVLMLAMALWLVSPVIPPAAQMIGWTALFLGYGFYLLRAHRHFAAMALGAAFAILGAIQLVGVATGGRDALAPLAHLGVGAPKHGLTFTRIKTVEQLDAALANANGKTVMLDFYADWCVSCIEMEKLTFVDERVQAKLNNTLLLQVDVTANDEADRAMLKRFTLFGPPAIILFDNTGQEIADSRVIGYQAPDKFLTSLSRLN
ncbi:protein-disulfide reductase DsbD [Massilia sp. GCM10020059]|uniref:Thiol:disulfide interchange protein DsbD n=1 Tax=Massilia agrisoli TaxID=2892444 RepID=A0ABS8IM69_9BURK|nr:protein-disulfide reductase DsbD [Massilia agrisoli]MCC6069381.1 protein-disulfide reductase DsbD [Massilia agrisoli]